MMKKVRQSNPAWGFRLILAFLKNRGERLGKKRAHRLYMQAKLSLHRNPKKPRLKRSVNGDRLKLHWLRKRQKLE